MARRGGFKAKWTAAQKRGVIHAGLDGPEELSARQVTEDAHAGRLPGLAPFPMPYATVARLLTDERARRRAEQIASAAPEAIARAASLELCALLARRVQRARNAEIRGKLDLATVEQLAKAARAVLALERDLNRQPSRRATNDADGHEPPAGFLDRLAAERPE